MASKLTIYDRVVDRFALDERVMFYDFKNPVLLKVTISEMRSHGLKIDNVLEGYELVGYKLADRIIKQ